MFVEVEGEPDENGLLMDFKDLKLCLKELVEAWDHATVVDRKDEELLEVLRTKGWKHFVLPYDSTAENMCIFAAEYLLEHSSTVLRARNIHTVTVRISETETCYAEAVRHVEPT